MPRKRSNLSKRRSNLSKRRSNLSKRRSNLSKRRINLSKRRSNLSKRRRKIIRGGVNSQLQEDDRVHPYRLIMIDLSFTALGNMATNLGLDDVVNELADALTVSKDELADAIAVSKGKKIKDTQEFYNAITIFIKWVVRVRNLDKLMLNKGNPAFYNVVYNDESILPEITGLALKVRENINEVKDYMVKKSIPIDRVKKLKHTQPTKSPDEQPLEMYTEE